VAFLLREFVMPGDTPSFANRLPLLNHTALKALPTILEEGRKFVPFLGILDIAVSKMGFKMKAIALAVRKKLQPCPHDHPFAE
jgi:hypothetical protein